MLLLRRIAFPEFVGVGVLLLLRRIAFPEFVGVGVLLLLRRITFAEFTGVGVLLLLRLFRRRFDRLLFRRIALAVFLDTVRLRLRLRLLFEGFFKPTYSATFRGRFPIFLASLTKRPLLAFLR